LTLIYGLRRRGVGRRGMPPYVEGLAQGDGVVVEVENK